LIFRDKAGAYGIQDAGGMLIKSIDGDFYTIMGLPLHALMQKLLNKSYSFD
jgi:septum formation protein